MCNDKYLNWQIFVKIFKLLRSPELHHSDICNSFYNVLLPDKIIFVPFLADIWDTCVDFVGHGCPTFLPSNLCIHNQKDMGSTGQLSHSCIPHRHSGGNGGDGVWEEIYSTNWSRVLKKLWQALLPPLPVFSSLPCSPLFFPSYPTRNPTEKVERPANPMRLPQQSVTSCVQLQLYLSETIRTWTPLTPCGGFIIFTSTNIKDFFTTL